MEPDTKRIRIVGRPPEEVENEVAMLLLLPPEIRGNIILDQITDFADLMMLKNVSVKLRDWMNLNDVVLRWERKHLHSNDYWRSYLMQKFAFGDNVKVSLGNEESVQINFDSLFRHQHRNVFDDEIDDELDSLKDAFELILLCHPRDGFSLLTAYDAFFDASLKAIILQRMRADPEDREFFFFIYDGQRVYARWNAMKEIEVAIFILNVRKKRMFEFVIYLMEKFKNATFEEEAGIGRRAMNLRANIANA